MNRKQWKELAAAVLMGAALAGVIILLAGCVTENKAVGLSNGAGGFMLETTASASTGSIPTPTIWLAGNVLSYASAPALDDGKKTQVVFTMCKRRSFFGSLFGVDDSSTSMSYIGSPGESAEETAKRLSVFENISSTSTATDSKAD